MKYIRFNYVDLKGKRSVREAFVIQEPSDKVMCLDVSELDQESQARFAGEYSKMYDDFKINVTKLQKEFELQHKIRQFFPENMDVLEQDVV